MFDSAGRKFFIGVVASTLLSATAINAVWAESETHHLIYKDGPVLLPTATHDKPCVQTPKTPNDPSQRYKECGDIGDRDGDGIPDDEDQCPDNTPEEIAQGVYDNQEPPRHPNNKPPVRECDKVGCPIDTDGDGVPDYRDRCPDTSPEYIVQAPACMRHECVDEQGCVPDSDEDGIIDCQDNCKNTPAKFRDKVAREDMVDPRTGKRIPKGCAQDDVVVKNLLASTLFDFDKSTLKAAGKQALNELVAEIKASKELQGDLSVIGHTDPIGSDAYNQRLSVKRAKSVVDYLVNRGIPASKLRAEGRGERELVSQEAGEPRKAWHARCRRVEVKTSVLR
jgi:OOP family OmpA-OmpF porin